MAAAVRASEGRLDLLVVGHTNIDRFLHVESLPAVDRTVPVLEAREALGGTAANIARVATGWGVRSGILSLVGADFPASFRDQMRREGVDTRGLLTVPGGRSPYCVIVEDGRGGQFTLIDQAAMNDEARGPIPRHLIEGARWIHLTTGPPEYQLRVLRLAQELGLHVSVDPAQEIHYRWSRGRLSRLVGGADILFGNRSEIDRVQTLLRVDGREALLEKVPLIVETRAGRGAIAWSRTGPVSVPAAPHRRLAQVTGAGDAFRGGFYAGWFAGQPLATSLRAGARSAARWIESGGTPPRRPSRRKSR